MNFGLINNYPFFVFLAIIIVFIIICVRLFLKKKIDETLSVKLFFDVVGLLSTIPLGYYIISGGKFIFGNEPKDLMYPIGITIIFIIIHSVKEISSYIRKTD